MKTITEFVVVTFKTADRVRGELTAAGKTPEETTAGLGEALKLEGDKLTHFMSAVELVGEKTKDLKRVVVFTLAEGEKPPAKAVERSGTWFLVEHYPPVGGMKQTRSDDRDERGGRGGRGGKGGKGGRGGRDDKRGGGGGGGRGPRPEGPRRPEGGGAPIAIPAAAAGGRPPRQERKPRPPKVENVPYVPGTPSSGKFKIVPKGVGAPAAAEQKSESAPESAPSSEGSQT